MTSSVEGLITSKVLPSTDLTNSLLMKLFHVSVGATNSGVPELRSSEAGGANLQTSGLVVLARLGSLELHRNVRHIVLLLIGYQENKM